MQGAAGGSGERQAKAQAQEWAAAAGSAADAGPDSAGGPGAVRPECEVGGEASRAVASGGVGMVVGAAAGSQGGRQQEVGGRAGHGAVGGSGERGGSIATKGAGRGTCRQRVCWFMQAASASCGRRAGAWPSLLAAWRWGEAGVGDVSWAVASGKQRYARCTQVRSQAINTSGRHYFSQISRLIARRTSIGGPYDRRFARVA